MSSSSIKLKTLCLNFHGDMHDPISYITENLIQYIAKNNQLTTLRYLCTLCISFLSLSDVTQDHLPMLASLSNLKTLQLSATGRSLKFGELFSKISQIETLSLNWMQFSNETSSDIETYLPKLQRLHLNCIAYLFISLVTR